MYGNPCAEVVQAAVFANSLQKAKFSKAYAQSL